MKPVSPNFRIYICNIGWSRSQQFKRNVGTACMFSMFYFSYNMFCN